MVPKDIIPYMLHQLQYATGKVVNLQITKFVHATVR